MDIGTSVVTATGIVTLAVTILKFTGKMPANQGQNGARESKESKETKEKCPFHGTIEKALSDGEERMDKMATDITIVKQVVIAMAAKQNIPVDALQAELQAMVR